MGAEVERGEFAEIVRRETAAVVAHLARLVRDLDRAEDLFQDVITRALESWIRDGLPDNPGAWLMTAARHRAIDVLRRDARDRARIADEGEAVATREESPTIADDRLRLVFACCHPALSVDSSVALTLRLVAGLKAAEIARAFVTTEPTIAQRLVRAKRTIRDAGLRYEVPDRDELEERLAAVLRVIYLIFNEGFVASAGEDLARVDLVREGIHLARCVVELLPDEAEPRGLLALLLLHGSRQRTRTDADGGLVLLEHQDRSRWDREAIGAAEGELRWIDQHASAPGPYAIEAAIAACHGRAPNYAATDWRAIAELYERLEALTRSPVTTLNRAVALAFAEGPEKGLALLDTIEEPLREYHLFHATRGDLLRRLGRFESAAAAFTAASTLTANAREQAFLRARAAECESAGTKN